MGIVDTILVGHLEKVSYVGAVAVGSMIFSIVYWGFGFLRMGTTGLTAQAYGRKDERECMTLLGRTVLIALLAATVLIVCQDLIAWLSFKIISTTPEVQEYAERYFYVRIYAAPATLGLYAFHGWFLGMQNAKYPMILSLLTNTANIGFTLYFMVIQGMGVEGAAMGTVAAEVLP